MRLTRYHFLMDAQRVSDRSWSITVICIVIQIKKVPGGFIDYFLFNLLVIF